MFSEPPRKPSNEFFTSLITSDWTNGDTRPCDNRTSSTVSHEAVIVTSEQSYLLIRAQDITVVVLRSRLINWALLLRKLCQVCLCRNLKAYITVAYRAANCLISGTVIIPLGAFTAFLQMSWSRSQATKDAMVIEADLEIMTSWRASNLPVENTVLKFLIKFCFKVWS